MVQRKTLLKVADNTGGHEMYIIHIYGGSRVKFAYLGKIVRCVIKRAEPMGTVKDGEQVFAVIARTRKELRRVDGSHIRFDDNAGIVIDNMKDRNPRGTRIFGPVARELKDKGFNKIISMAGEVL